MSPPPHPVLGPLSIIPLDPSNLFTPLPPNPWFSETDPGYSVRSDEALQSSPFALGKESSWARTNYQPSFPRLFSPFTGPTSGLQLLPNRDTTDSGLSRDVLTAPTHPYLVSNHMNGGTLTHGGLAPEQWRLAEGGAPFSGSNNKSQVGSNPVSNPAVHGCPLCSDKFSSLAALVLHLWHTHERRMCQQCKEHFPDHYNLEMHADKSHHIPWICDQSDCGSTFSRLDTFQRHQKSHEEHVPRFPCKYCRKHRGPHGFKRKDHLNQHLRGYHHMDVDKRRRGNYDKLYCPHKECSEYRAKCSYYERPFKAASEYTEHMRMVHDESDFPCFVSGCDRVGAKGYFRKIDLRKHMKKVHGIDRLEDASR